MHQRIRGFTLWHEPDFPRTRTLRVQRHTVAEFLAGDQEKREPAADSREAASARAADVSGVRRILAELCCVPPDRIGADDRISEDLNLDSLGRVQFLSAVEADLGVYIDEQELGEGTTVADLERTVV